MIAEPNGNGNGHAKNGHANGGLGGNLREVGPRDTRMIARAIRERWPIPDERRAALIERQMRTAEHSESDRDATRAFQSLLQAEAQNIAVALKAIDKVLPDQHSHTHAIEQIQARLDEFRAFDDPDDGPNLGGSLPGQNGNGRH